METRGGEFAKSPGGDDNGRLAVRPPATDVDVTFCIPEAKHVTVLAALQLELKAAEATAAKVTQTMADLQTRMKRVAGAGVGKRARANSGESDCGERGDELNDNVIPEAQLRAMLVREEHLRLAPETQRRYATAESDWRTDWIVVTEQLQRDLVNEFGHVGAAAEASALNQLRTATHRYPSLRDIPLYIRHNRARAGTIVPGDVLPDAAVSDLNGKKSTLLRHHSALGGGVPTLMVSGSIT
mmetsp:Transcript_3420/g.8452  ORF Transcript_3420/g.8452 Transcript_3420/m.8452 type:complete len:241 (-) Transcript_3420:919-1641(-)